MTSKTLLTAAAFLLAATSASLAQGYYGGPYAGYGPGYYDYAPDSGAYGYAPGYGYRGPGYFDRDDIRGGPGPRVGAGGGAGSGTQR